MLNKRILDLIVISITCVFIVAVWSNRPWYVSVGAFCSIACLAWSLRCYRQTLRCVEKILRDIKIGSSEFLPLVGFFDSACDSLLMQAHSTWGSADFAAVQTQIGVLDEVSCRLLVAPRREEIRAVVECPNLAEEFDTYRQKLAQQLAAIVAGRFVVKTHWPPLQAELERLTRLAK